eukprot:78537-Pleurochrysis_carterae.AAC.2
MKGGEEVAGRHLEGTESAGEGEGEDEEVAEKAGGRERGRKDKDVRGFPCQLVRVQEGQRARERDRAREREKEESAQERERKRAKERGSESCTRLELAHRLAVGGVDGVEDGRLGRELLPNVLRPNEDRLEVHPLALRETSACTRGESVSDTA